MRDQITRRRVLQSLTMLTAGTLIRPGSILAAGPVKDKFRCAIVGDWGTGDRDAAAVAGQMIGAHRQSPLDFVIAVGDNIYPNGSGRYFSKHFEQPFAQLLRERINFYAVLGNHDVEQGRDDQRQYPLFNMGGKTYYTLQQGDGLVEFFMLDSTDFDSAQAGWLEQSLKVSTARWKIPIFHHPIYSSGKKHGSNLELRRKLEPLLVQYGISVAFSGHDHIYERVKPQQGIHYFVTGAGGKARRGGTDLNSPFRAASFDDDNHFMLIEVDDQQVNFQAISETSKIVDQGVIKRA